MILQAMLALSLALPAHADGTAVDTDKFKTNYGYDLTPFLPPPDDGTGSETIAFDQSEYSTALTLLQKLRAPSLPNTASDPDSYLVEPLVGDSALSSGPTNLGVFGAYAMPADPVKFLRFENITIDNGIFGSKIKFKYGCLVIKQKNISTDTSAPNYIDPNQLADSCDDPMSEIDKCVQTNTTPAMGMNINGCAGCIQRLPDLPNISGKVSDIECK